MGQFLTKSTLLKSLKLMDFYNVRRLEEYYSSKL